MVPRVRSKAPDQVRGGIHLLLTLIRQVWRMAHFVYILASRPGGALYTGRTGDLRRRVAAHRAGLSEHTRKYNIKTLVWFECHDRFEDSLKRERQIKRWCRDWKIALVLAHNPDWRDICAQIPDR